MEAIGRLASLAALQIRMHHFAHDRPRPDDGDLHHDVVKTFWPQARQASHLRAALDLKHADGVGLLQRIVNDRIIGGQASQVDLFAVILLDDFQRIFEHGHHAQAEQIDLHNAHIGAIFLVPLHHHASGHGGGFERHNRIELPLANHHSAGMLPQMARQILNQHAEVEKFADQRMAGIEAGIVKLARERVIGVFIFPGAHQAGQTIQRFRLDAIKLCRFPGPPSGRDR